MSALEGSPDEPHNPRGKAAAPWIVALAFGLVLATNRFAGALGQTLGNTLERHGYAADHLGWVTAHVLLLLALPLAIAWIVRKEKPADLGLGKGDLAWWSKLVLALVPVVLVCAFVLSRLPGVAAFYQAHTARGRAELGGIPWIASWAAYFFAWEFLFRGVLVVRVGQIIGPAKAIALHLIPFVAVHLGKPPLEVALAVPGGLALGAVAWRARSMIPAFVLHLSLAQSLDFFATTQTSASALHTLAPGG